MLRTVHTSVAHSFTPVETYVQYDGQGRLHIGAIIREYLEQNGTRYSSFASKIGMSRAGLYNVFKDRHINTERLEKICQVTGHNFFQYYADYFSKAPLEVAHSVNEKTAEYKKPSRLVLEIEDGEIVSQKLAEPANPAATENDLRAEMAEMKAQQQQLFDQLQQLLPKLAAQQNQAPDTQLGNDDAEK
jgi:transcriptional regulator with XRE-family HTH domain